MTSSHPQENREVESFSKTLHKGVTNIYGINKDEWDHMIPRILWVLLTSEIDRLSTGRTSPVQGCLNNPSHLI